MSISVIEALIIYRSREKNCAARNFDLMTNSDNFGVAHGISVKFGLWTFHKLYNKEKKFDFLDFWLP